MLPEQKNRVPITQSPNPFSAAALKPAPVISGQNRNTIPATPITPPSATRGSTFWRKTRKPSTRLNTEASENTTESSPDGTLNPP